MLDKLIKIQEGLVQEQSTDRYISVPNFLFSIYIFCFVI